MSSIVRGEVDFEVPDGFSEELVEDWGYWLSSYLHDEIDIAFNLLLKPAAYKVVGIRVGQSSSGTLWEEGG